MNSGLGASTLPVDLSPSSSATKSMRLDLIVRLVLFCFETESCYEVQASFELAILLPPSAVIIGMSPKHGCIMSTLNLWLNSSLKPLGLGFSWEKINFSLFLN
jgi:hypothetical protein